MSSGPYTRTKESENRSIRTRSPISSSSSSPDAYKEYKPSQYHTYNKDTNNSYYLHEYSSSAMYKRRVPPSPPSNRRLTPSPPPYSRRVAPSPPPPFLDYHSSSVRLKSASAGEWSPPPVKRRIAPPPPESFTNQARGSDHSDNDYTRQYNASSKIDGYDNERRDAVFDNRFYFNDPGEIATRPRVGYSQKYPYNRSSPINGPNSHDFRRDTFDSSRDTYSHGSIEHDSMSYANTRYHRNESQKYHSDYREHYREPKVRKPPPPPHIPASSKCIESQQSSTNEPSSGLKDATYKDSSQNQNEEGECISDAENEEGEEGEWISNTDRSKYQGNTERCHETQNGEITFDPNSTASLDEQEKERGNSIILRHHDNILPSEPRPDDKIEVVPKKPSIPLHIQKSPLKGSFISSSILTRDENNMYKEVKKDNVGLDESSGSVNLDVKETDEDIENISGESDEDEDNTEFERERENKNTIEKDPLTLDYLKQSSRLMLDSKFLAHLAEMHPVSALNELSHKLNWATPNFSIAFECGPPMSKMYIFKVLINGQSFQPTIAVDNKKDAKQNVAWYALQEMGFVKPDPANPL